MFAAVASEVRPAREVVSGGLQRIEGDGVVVAPERLAAPLQGE
jgi:hypothetical protein